MNRKTDNTGEGRYDYALDRVLHEKARLGILTSLAAHPEGLSFSDLKELCALSDGNLSRHLQVLEEAKLVEVKKSFRDRRPHTAVRLTVAGRKSFLAYLAELERVIRDVQASAAHARPAAAVRVRPLPAT